MRYDIVKKETLMSQTQKKNTKITNAMQVSGATVSSDHLQTPAEHGTRVLSCASPKICGLAVEMLVRSALYGYRTEDLTILK